MDTILSSFLQVLLDNLEQAHVKKFIRTRKFEKEVQGLKDTLMKVNGAIHMAEILQHKDEKVKSWLNDLNEAANDAENVIDDFATEALRIELENKRLGELEDADGDVEEDVIDEASSEIQAITKRFDDLSQKRFELGLMEVAAGTSSLLDINHVYGRDDDKKKIINLLLRDTPRDEDRISIIPIVGMGGVGKTTLAQIVYNDDQVKDHFNLRAWFCVSDASSLENITNIIVESITSRSSSMMDFDEIQDEVKQTLIGKKFLIVLDDVCVENFGDWNLLWRSFGVRAAGVGSKIIVTTRSRKIGMVHYHYLQPLSENDCWYMFVQHAFPNRSVDGSLYMAIICKEMVRKCQGLPLAVKLLGGILRSKQQHEWDNVLNSKIWKLQEKDGIPPVLKLCYYFLPSHLHYCFRYCSIFPKRYEFGEKQVVLLWMAEGFLQQAEEEMDLEDFGHKCFGELLSMSFFQPSSSKKGLFVMHDLISDLAQWVAGEYCFRLEDLSDRGKQCRISEKARHFSYISGAYDGVQKFEALNGVPRLRTFLPLSIQNIDRRYLTTNVTFDLLPKLKFLRVLSLCGYCIIELPSSIGDLKHLRYLDLSQTKIKSLPESVSTMYNLQTLLLKNCSNLNKLPEEMKNLVNLRHLDISENQLKTMPPIVGELTGLRELSNFVVGEVSGCGIGELFELIHLQGTLWISKLENVFNALEARKANLCDKKGLQVLTLEWSINYEGNENVEKEVLDMLRPHDKLRELTIKGYRGLSFPTWIGDPSFSNMMLLKLEGCSATALPPLGRLSLLKDLSIERMNGVVTVDSGFYGKGCINPFPSLETLSIQDMPVWKNWRPCEIYEQGSLFPRLRELSIIECPELLESFPDHLPSLEKLVVCQCEELVVTLSSLPKLCELEIRNCQEVMQTTAVDLNSLKTVVLESNGKATFVTKGLTEWSTGIEDLEILGCEELVFLWQKKENVLQHLALLRRLEITDCPQFVSLEEEQGLICRSRLKSLVLARCGRLKNLEGLHKLSSLRELSIEECPQVASFPESGLPATLRELRILNCSALKSLSNVIGWHYCRNATLDYLFIRGCDSLRFIATSVLFSTVKELKIERCPSLQYLTDEQHVLSKEKIDEHEAPSYSLLDPWMTRLNTDKSPISLLESLSIYDCSSLMSLFSSSSKEELPATLKSLFIWYCRGLESLGNWFYNNSSLDIIDIRSCYGLKSLPENLHSLTGLSEFCICHSYFFRFPEGGLPPANLRKLRIECCDQLQAVLDHIHALTSLQELLINDNQRTVSFPKKGLTEKGLPTNITKLEIRGSRICKLLFGWGFHRLHCLRELSIPEGCPGLFSFPEMGMKLPSSLILLSISVFPDLLRLTSEGFQNLTSLERLRIEYCPNLEYFPEKGLFPSLLRLDILGCPKLKQELGKRDQRQEWPKISHIPCVTIDGDEGFI